MSRFEFKGARVAAAAGLGLTLALGAVPAVALAEGASAPVVADADDDSAVEGSLQSKIDAAQGSKVEITLTQDVAESITIPENTTVTLNLGNFTLSGSSSNHTIANKGTLVINADGGSVTNDVAGHATLANYPGAVATLNGGTFTDDAWYTIKNLGSLEINAGVTVQRSDSGSSMIATGWYGKTGNDLGLSVNDCPSSTPVLTINGGTFSGGMNTIKNDDGGITIINGGDFSNTSGPVIMNWNVTTITGGKFTGSSDSSPLLSNGYLNNNGMDQGLLTITGGTFTAAGGQKGSLFGYGVGAVQGGEVTITGGAFTGSVRDQSGSAYEIEIAGGKFMGSVDKACVASGMKKNENNEIVIDYEKAFATVDGKGYATLAEAVASAEQGDVVTLLKDVELTNYILADKSFVLDLGKHKLTQQSDSTFVIAAVNNSVVTIQNGSVVGGDKQVAFIAQGGGFETSNVEIQAWRGFQIGVNSGQTKATGSLVVNEGTVIKASEAGIVALGVYDNDDVDGKDGQLTNRSSVIINGGEINAQSYAISGNGTCHGTDIAVNGGTITSAETVAIYHPQAGSLTLSGGSISGRSGVQMCSGSLIVPENSTVSVTGVGEDDRDGKEEDDGGINDGAAVSLVNRGYPGGTPTISLKGGTFISEMSDAVLDYTWSEKTSSSWDDAGDYAEITGGTYSTTPLDLVERDFVVKINDDGTYSPMKKGALGPGTYQTVEGDKLDRDDFLSGLIVTVDPDTGEVTAARPVTPPAQTGEAVSVKQPEDATIKVSPSRAEKGDAVTVTVTPDEGREVTSVTVTDEDGRAVAVKPGEKDGTWTFEMPDGAVTVTATTRCDGGELCPTHGLSDVEVGAWYHDGADWAVETGLMGGMGDGTFAPSERLSRAQLAAMLWNRAGNPSPENAGAASSFVDTDANGFYAEALAWCVETGAFMGLDDTHFGPADDITREQLAVVLWRMADEPASDQDLSDYPDGSDVSAFADTAVRWAVETGVLSGQGDGSLDPQGAVDRAQAAAIFQRLAE